MSKVILLAPTPPPAGGIAGWTVRMMNAQLKNGWQVEVVDEKFTDDRQVFGDKSNRNLFAETKRCFRIWRDLGRALKDPDALVVHSCIPSMTPSMLREYICACITKSQKRKFIIHFRCTVPNTTKTRLGKYVLKKLCDKSDMIITLNAQTNEYLEKITKTPMKLIPNFVSESELAQTHIIREKIEKVLCVGGVVESKGAYEVLELAQRFPDIEFRFVGHADSSVLGYAREQNISNAVFTGQKSREAVKEELADADVFVHLTHYFGEGFSNAILEAMAAGLPCIVTDWASNKEMIGDKNMVVNVGDVDAAANLLRILNSPEERRKQSELNIQKIKAEYLDVHVPNQYVDAYEACIGKCAKRVLLISVKSDVSRGGIAVWTDRFLESCNKFEITCDLVNTETIGKRRERSTAKLNIVDEIIRTRRIFKDLKSFLTDVPYNAVHLNTSCGTYGLFRDYMCAKQIKKSGIRLITHFHCDIPYWIKNPISRRALGKLVSLSDERIVLCENSRKYLEENFVASSHKVPNFINESLIIDREKHVSEVLQTAIFVGRVEEAKGAKELYELARRFPKIGFRLVGDVNETVATWSKPENVELVGALPHSQVIANMDNADIFVFPSHSEGFSLALTEAMARGLPCIATDVGANADMLDGGCGVIVAKGDIDAMEKSIQYFLEPEVRETASKNAINKVKTYTAGPVLKKLIDYYNG